MHAYNYYSEGKNETEKLYLRLLLVTDYICGMTDTYAKTLYQELCGIV
jgi:dGTPase